MSRYENYAIKNNVFGTLSAPISSLATTIQLNSWQWARFSVNQLATLENVEDWKVKKREIVKITAIAWDVLTVVRKYAPCPSSDDANTQWQVSYAFSADDTISAYITKEHFDKIDGSINDIYDNWVNKLRTEIVSWLQIKVNAWPVLVGSAYYDFAWWTLTLTDNATNYIEVDEDWLLVNNTTWRTLENTKISKVVASWWEITSVEDWRLWTVWWKIWWTDIHELTEKTSLSPNDEFIIADSDNIYNNKKVKYSNIIQWNIIKLVELWENVTAGDWQWAAYIWADGKAYLTDLWDENKNRMDWIILDGWNTGDTIRMITGWDINSSINGPVCLSWNIQTKSWSVALSNWYLTVNLGASYMLSRIRCPFENADWRRKRAVSVDWVFIWLYAQQFINLDWLKWQVIQLDLRVYSSWNWDHANNSRTVDYVVNYYASWNKGQYWAPNNYCSQYIIWAANGKRFGINKKFNLRNWALSVLAGTGGVTNVFQAKHNWYMYVSWKGDNAGAELQYSPNNSIWYWASIWDNSIKTFCTVLIKWYYYRVSYYWNAKYLFIDNIIYTD